MENEDELRDAKNSSNYVSTIRNQSIASANLPSGSNESMIMNQSIIN